MMRMDPQHNLLSVLLAGAIGLLVLIALVAFAVLGRVDVERIAAERTTDELLEAQLARTEPLAALSEFGEVLERPVFFAERTLPAIELASAEGDDELVDEAPAPVEVPALKASVDGIIITPDVKLAMVKPENAGRAQVLREGMTLEGELSAWKLAVIEDRSVRFETDTGERAQLDLTVETQALKTGAPPRARQAQTQAQAQAETAEQPAEAGQQSAEQASAEALARAEEIRRRVAERRAQLRAEAERRARERDNDG